MHYINTIKKACLVLAFLFASREIAAQDISDRAIKKNIAHIDDPLQRITQLQPRQFEYNTARFSHLRLRKGTQYGFLAEDMQTVFPDLVNDKTVSYKYGKNVYRNATVKTINEAGLIPLLVASVKEQQTEIEKLKTEILELKKVMALSND